MFEGIDLSDQEKERLRSVLLKKRILFLQGDITEEGAAAVRDFLLVLTAESQEEIVLYIDSPGGELQPALWLYDLIKNSSASVKGIVNGKALSAAVLVLQACAKRQATAHSLLLVHGLSKEVSFDKKKLGKAIREGKKAQSRILDILSACTGKPISQIEKKFGQELDAQEAKEFGLVDEVI